MFFWMKKKNQTKNEQYVTMCVGYGILKEIFLINNKYIYYKL